MIFLDMEIAKLIAGELKSRRSELLAGKCMDTSWPAANLKLASARFKFLEFEWGVFTKVVALSLSFSMP